MINIVSNLKKPPKGVAKKIQTPQTNGKTGLRTSCFDLAAFLTVYSSRSERELCHIGTGDVVVGGDCYNFYEQVLAPRYNRLIP